MSDEKKALFIFDLQIDRCQDGPVEIPGANTLIHVANELMSNYDKVVLLRDWHPATHLSFAANHPWRHPYKTMMIEGEEQMLWPIHCVQNSFGADWPDGLEWQKADLIIDKGTEPSDPGDDGFVPLDDKGNSILKQFLRSENIQSIDCMGLNADHGIRSTIETARSFDFQINRLDQYCLDHYIAPKPE